MNSHEELTVVSTCLSDESARYDVLTVLSEDHFESQQARELFSCIKQVIKAGKSVTPTEVGYVYAELLGLDKTKTALMMFDYFSSGYYLYKPDMIQNIISRYSDRKLVSELILAAKSIESKTRTSAEVADHLRKKFSEIALEKVDSCFTAKEALKRHPQGLTFREAFEKRERDLANGLSTMSGLSYGYSKLDEITDGISEGSLVVLAARTSLGKTQLALNIIVNWLFSGHPIGILSMEMPVYQINHRLLGLKSGISVKNIQSTKITAKERETLFAAEEWYTNSKFIIDDTSGLTPSQVRAKIWHMKQKLGIKVCVIDFLTLMHSDKKSNNNHERFSDIIQSLQAIGKELQVAIFLIAQLNRDNDKEEREPRLSDIRESGAIEQAADQVWLLHRDDFNTNLKGSGMAKLIIAKNRGEGTRGVIDLSFDFMDDSYSESELPHVKTNPFSTAHMKNGRINKKI